MYSPLLLLLAVIAAPSLVWSFTLKGSIPLDGLLSNVVLHPSSKVVLNHSSKYAMIRQDGTFEFPDLFEGEYILTPHIPDYIFHSYLLTLTSSSSSSESDHTNPVSTSTLIPHIQLLYPGKSTLSPLDKSSSSSSSSSLSHPITLRPIGLENYYTPKGGVNVLGMLKNPIVLMMLASGIMMFGLPKLMASVDSDPELKKEMAEARKRMNGMQAGLTGGLSNMLTGGGASDSATGGDTPQLAQASKGGGGGGGGGNSKGNGVQRRRGK